MSGIDAAKRAGAREIVTVLPYFPYARQDKKDQSRGPIGAKMIANMLASAWSDINNHIRFTCRPNPRVL